MADQSRARAIIAEALSREIEERVAFLDLACGDDRELRREVEELLAAATESEEPPTLPGHQGFADAARLPDTNQEVPGMMIGPYQILQKIGEGGFGDVWAAQQWEPIKRKVALKIIKLGMDTREVIARFETERQALALLDHPGIAKVFDAGKTAGGRPFFAMELVHGEPILQFCDAAELDTRDRLKLFIKVCQAIQHAHQKGIIHRDIKPSNILVTFQEGEPAPKVIDFGIAKATNAELIPRTFYTQFDRVVGTPAYMSPEQATKSDLDIDTRSDIYSLGMLLYELLAGVTPFDLDQLNQLGYSEMMRVLRETEFPRPSTRISNLGETAARSAAARRTDTQKLKLSLRGDLDWIVLRCLEKDRSRRYETAGALAEDIRRHLDNRPVEAGPPGAGYRIRKFARRHRAAVVAGTIVAATLVFGIVGTTWGLVRALREEQRTRQALEELEQVTAFQAAQLSEIDSRLMGERLKADFLDRRRAALAARGLDEQAIAAEMAEAESAAADVNFTDLALKALEENIFDRALAAIEEEFAENPIIKARLLQTLADTLRTVGLLDRAMGPQTEALEIRLEILGEEHADTLFTINSLANLLQFQGKIEEAEQHVRRSLEIGRRVLGDDHPNTLTAINNMGFLLRRQGRAAEAEPFYREALERRRRLLGDEDPVTLISLNNLAVLLQFQGKWAEAEPYLREVVETRRRVLGDLDLSTLNSINNLGQFYREVGRLDEAEPFYREALEGRRRTLGGDHLHTMTSIHNMGRLLLDMGHLDEAETYLTDGFERRRRVLGEEHPDTFSSIRNLGLLRQTQGRLTEAEALFRTALEGRRRVLGESHPRTFQCVRDVGSILHDQGRFRESVAFLSEHQAQAEQIWFETRPHELAEYMANLGKARMGLGRPDDLAAAEQDLHRAHELFARAHGAGHQSTLEAKQTLIELYEIRHAAEPGAGHEIKAADLQAQYAAASTP